MTDLTALFEAPAPLRRGRHGMTREEVDASQRIRLLLAITEEVGQRGYADTTIAHITGAADVSKKTFYAHFKDKEACYSTAYDAFSDFLLDQMRQARKDLTQQPVDRYKASVSRYLEVLKAQPVRARALLVEVLKAGDAILSQRRRVLEEFEQDLRSMVEETAGAENGQSGLADTAYRITVGGVDESVRLLLIEGRSEELSDLTDPIVQCFDQLAWAHSQLRKSP